MSEHKFDNIDEALHKWLDQPEPAPKTGADLGLPADNPFHDASVVSVCNESDAIEDGFLVDVTQDARRCGIAVKRALISRGIWDQCIVPRSPVRGKDSKGENVIEPTKPLNHLFLELAKAVKAAGPGEESMWWFDFEGKKVKAVCEQGRLTMCFPEED